MIPSVEYLSKKGIKFELRTFPSDTEKNIVSIAKALNVETNIVVKTIVVKGSSGKLYICLACGEGRLDFKKLKSLTNEKDITMAPPDEIFEQTGYKVGAIPPVALKREFLVFIDETLQKEEKLFVGAGVFGNEIVISAEELQKGTKGKFEDIIK